MLKRASPTSPLVTLGPATATTEKPNDEHGSGLNERDVKKEPGDSAEEPSTSKIPEVSHYASNSEDSIEILSDDSHDTDDEIEILQENIQKKK